MRTCIFQNANLHLRKTIRLFLMSKNANWQIYRCEISVLHLLDGVNGFFFEPSFFICVSALLNSIPFSPFKNVRPVNQIPISINAFAIEFCNQIISLFFISKTFIQTFSKKMESFGVQTAAKYLPQKFPKFHWTIRIWIGGWHRKRRRLMMDFDLCGPAKDNGKISDRIPQVAITERFQLEWFLPS